MYVSPRKKKKKNKENIQAENYVLTQLEVRVENVGKKRTYLNFELSFTQYLDKILALFWTCQM